MEEPNGLPLTVVGIVKDARWIGWDKPTASVYGPYSVLSRSPFASLLLRTTDRTGSVTAAVLQAIQQSDPPIRPTRAITLDDLLADSVRLRRLRSWVFGSFAAIALVVVGVGIFGTMAMSTARRSKEIAIRLALGGPRRTVVMQLLRELTVPISGGLLAGVILAGWAIGMVKSSLYEITAYDPRAWFAAIVLVITVSVGGALVPSIVATMKELSRSLNDE
jgi:ABC-type antimicrobial peptide transport system permease subunit